MGSAKRQWRLQKHGDGIPLSVFDQPDPKPVSKSGLLSPLAVNAIALVVTFIWAISFLADILVADYSPPGAIHLAFMVVLGSIFGAQIVQGRKSE